MSVLVKKSILARLLANENITVEQTNHSTAYFDIDKRILGIPYWKDISSDLYDLFVGHEIGHALYTPADGWHSSTTEIPNCPRAYVNIIEDIRIEKLVLNEYPGLLSGFMRGYQDLLDRDFFGIKAIDINTLSFTNRLNIFAKTRGLVEVRFTSTEQPYVDRAMAVKTWKDVLASCTEIYAFMKEELKKHREEMKEVGEGLPEKIIIKAGSGSNENTTPMSQELRDAIANGEVEVEVDIDSFTDSFTSQQDASTTPDSIGNSDDIDVVETDSLLRNCIAKALVDSINTGGKTIYIKGPTAAEANAITSSYENVENNRCLKCNSDDFEKLANPYIKFKARLKLDVNAMVKEFEMRKTARRYARATQSPKGSLDVNQLHKYKYDDNIFKSVTHFDDDLSHGMIMLIDYSGSMERILPKVLKQLLVLVSFCKRVNIPFEVYGFTTPIGYNNSAKISKSLKEIENTNTSICMDGTHIFELISSKLTKQKYEAAFKTLFGQSKSSHNNWYGSLERKGGTPLNTALAAMYHHIDAFRKTHKVQKLNFITLTDGYGDKLQINFGKDIIGRPNVQNSIIDILGMKIVQPITYGCYGNNNGSAFLEGIRKMGIRTVNYHIIAEYQIKQVIKNKDEAEIATAKYKKEGYFVLDNVDGYDRRIFTGIALQNNTNCAEEDDAFAESFTNSMFSKKLSRLIATKFAEIIS